MKQLLHIFPIALIFLVVSESMSQPLGGDSASGDPAVRDQVVPISSTLHWTNARELSVQLEHASDRAAFCDLIVAQSDSDPLLTPAQRLDGYSIAAGAYFLDGGLSEAEAVYNKILGLASDNHTLMNANRVLGIIRKSESDFEGALVLYKAAWIHAQAADPGGNDIMSDSVLANICMILHHLERYEEGLDYALLGSFYFQSSTTELIQGSTYLYWQYAFNKKLDDPQTARVVLGQLLDQYPQYGMSGYGNQRAFLRMERHALLGLTWKHGHLSIDFVNEAIDILNDDHYRFSTYRIHLANQLAEIYDADFPEKANEIRSVAYNRLMDDLDGAEISDYDRDLLLSAASLLLYNNALIYYHKLHDIDNALLELDALLAQGSVPDDISYLSTNLRTKLIELSTNP